MTCTVESQPLFGKPPDRQRVQAVFLCQYPGGERGDRILLLHRYPCLQYHRAAIDSLGHKVDAGAVLFAAGFKRLPVGMQAGKIRQQGRVNIQHPPLVVAYETGGQYAHEACQYDQSRLPAFNAFQ